MKLHIHDLRTKIIYSRICIIVMISLFLSCASRGTTSYFSQKMKDFPSTRPSDIQFYEEDDIVGKLFFIRMGYVYTSPFDGEARERHYRTLKKAAARMGAHGIYDVQHMDSSHYTYASDPFTPFPSFMHIRKERTILRGTAIRFLEEDQYTQ